MHQIRFSPGLRPGPRWGRSRRSPRFPSRPPRRLRRLTLSQGRLAPRTWGIDAPDDNNSNNYYHNNNCGCRPYLLPGEDLVDGAAFPVAQEHKQNDADNGKHKHCNQSPECDGHGCRINFIRPSTLCVQFRLQHALIHTITTTTTTRLLQLTDTTTTMTTTTETTTYIYLYITAIRNYNKIFQQQKQQLLLLLQQQLLLLLLLPVTEQNVYAFLSIGIITIAYTVYYSTLSSRICTRNNIKITVVGKNLSWGFTLKAQRKRNSRSKAASTLVSRRTGKRCKFSQRGSRPNRDHKCIFSWWYRGNFGLSKNCRKNLFCQKIFVKNANILNTETTCKIFNLLKNVTVHLKVRKQHPVHP